jgi:hypothetical protein
MSHLNRFSIFPLVCIAISSVSCSAKSYASSPTTTSSPITPTLVSIPPYATPTPYYSAPMDGSLDAACRITIDLFFSFKQGFSNEAYRDLFIPSSQYLADNVKPPTEAPVLLKSIPASQWWQENFPNKLIPGTILPTKSNEYFYHVEFTCHYELYTTPIFTFPDGMTMDMIVTGPSSCKIKGYGKG